MALAEDLQRELWTGPGARDEVEVVDDGEFLLEGRQASFVPGSELLVGELGRRGEHG